WIGATLQGELETLEHQVLAVGDLLDLLRGGVALDAEPLLLERPAVVERKDVQLAVVAQSHRFRAPPSLAVRSRARLSRRGPPVRFAPPWSTGSRARAT